MAHLGSISNRVAHLEYSMAPFMRCGGLIGSAPVLVSPTCLETSQGHVDSLVMLHFLLSKTLSFKI